jgi:hypothetical protein
MNQKKEVGIKSYILRFICAEKTKCSLSEYIESVCLEVYNGRKLERIK